MAQARGHAERGEQRQRLRLVQRAACAQALGQAGAAAALRRAVRASRIGGERIGAGLGVRNAGTPLREQLQRGLRVRREIRPALGARGDADDGFHASWG